MGIRDLEQLTSAMAWWLYLMLKHISANDRAASNFLLIFKVVKSDQSCFFHDTNCRYQRVHIYKQMVLELIFRRSNINSK